ncbi:MAG: hypothetical protein ABIJ80_03780 [Patescibacteria group bacterium]
MTITFAQKIVELAHYEIEWWKAHHRKQEERLVENMAKLYSLQFGIDIKTAKDIALLKATATDWHSLAEELEDCEKQVQANIYWQNAEKCLVRHFEALELARLNLT